MAKDFKTLVRMRKWALETNRVPRKVRYSSAKIAGIQVRGQNAIYINAMVALDSYPLPTTSCAHMKAFPSNSNHFTHNRTVAGSSPAGPTTSLLQ